MNTTDINQIATGIKNWADGVFPTRSVQDAIRKIVLEEAAELGKARTPAEIADEAADVLIIILDVIALQGQKPSDIINKKMEKNRTRDWGINELGNLAHIRTPEEQDMKHREIARSTTAAHSASDEQKAAELASVLALLADFKDGRVTADIAAEYIIDNRRV